MIGFFYLKKLNKSRTALFLKKYISLKKQAKNLNSHVPNIPEPGGLAGMVEKGRTYNVDVLKYPRKTTGRFGGQRSYTTVIATSEQGARCGFTTRSYQQPEGLY